MRLLSVISFLIASICLLIPAAMIKLPSEYLPWTPLNLNAPINFLTSYKLSRLASSPDACYMALTASDVTFRRLPDHKVGGCELQNMVARDKSFYPYSSSVHATCPMIASFILWENQILKPASLRHFSSDIARIEQLGIFACRKVRNSSNRLSQHATANAIDISGFQLKNGDRISVAKDWGQETPAGKFLEEVRDGSCSVFQAVLGPDYNSLHKDHFHLDSGQYRICR